METTELARKYLGKVAKNYEKRKASRPKWQAEHASVSTLLECIARNDRLLDVPCGTGRFFELYQTAGFKVSGIDISEDMLAIARDKADRLGLEADLQLGSIFNLPYQNGAFKCVVCIRILNWLGTEDMRRALKEMSRVSRPYVIFAVRTRTEYQTAGKRALALIHGVVRKLRYNGRRDRTTVHTRKEVQSALDEARLSAVKAIHVNFGTPHTMYEIILAEKST